MEEISLKDIINVLRSNLFLLLTLISLITLASVIYSLSLKNIFRSEAIFSIVDNNQQNAMSSLVSQFSGIAGMAGMQVPSGEASRKTPEYINATIKSRQFFKHLVTFDGVLENVYAANGFDSESQNSLYDKNSYDAQKNIWVRKGKPQTDKIPSYLEAHQFFLDQLYTEIDKKTGFIFISYDHVSPIFSKEIINLIFIEMNTLSRDIEDKESENAIQYYKKLVVDTKVNNILISINQLIEVELQKKMLANTKENFLIEYIDGPVVPIKRSYPRRSFIVIMGIFFGSILSILSILIKEFAFDRKKVEG